MTLIQNKHFNLYRWYRCKQPEITSVPGEIQSVEKRNNDYIVYTIVID